MTDSRKRALSPREHVEGPQQKRQSATSEILDVPQHLDCPQDDTPSPASESSSEAIDTMADRDSGITSDGAPVGMVDNEISPIQLPGNEKRSELLAIIDKLRELGAGEDISLPQVRIIIKAFVVWEV